MIILDILVAHGAQLSSFLNIPFLWFGSVNILICLLPLSPCFPIPLSTLSNVVDVGLRLHVSHFNALVIYNLIHDFYVKGDE